MERKEGSHGALTPALSQGEGGRRGREEESEGEEEGTAGADPLAVAPGSARGDR